MKKLIFLIAIFFTAETVKAQLNTTLVLAATPPATLSEWGTRKEILTYIISSQPGATFPVIIKAEIKTTDGTVIGTTDLSKARVITLSSSTTILYAVDVLPLENILFSGKYKTSIQRTGKLPADNYILCVQLVRPVDYTPASAAVCKTFYLASTQLPVLMKPYNEEVLDAKSAQTAIMFRWTPTVPRPSFTVTYHIQVFEVLKDQSPMQALRSNQPMLDKELIGITQYIWQPQIAFHIGGTWGGDCGSEKNIKPGSSTDSSSQIIQACHKFIWTIQTLDDRGLPITQTDGNGEARSEPIVFFVKPNKNPKPQKGN